MSDITKAVFWAFLILAVFLIIANAPLFQAQKRYFYFLGAMMFFYYPILILYPHNN